MNKPRRLFLVIGLLAGLAAVAGAAAWAFTPRAALASSAPQVPTALVARGNLAITVHLVGEVQTDKSITLVPPQAGVPLRLVRVVETGEAVKAGQVVMEFDPGDQQHALEQSDSQLLEAEQEIIKARANQEVQAAQNNTQLLNARFNLRRAEMDALTPTQFLGVNEAKKRQLAVSENKRRLAELEDLMSSRQAVDRAALASLEQRRNSARVAATRAQQIISQLDVTTPIDGSVVVKENRDNTTFFYSGMTVPEYRSGDTVLPGRIVLEIIDTSKVQIRARVSEQDRPNIAVGQKARVQADGLGGEWLEAKVDSVAGLATRQPSDGVSPIRRFDLTLRVSQPERLPPGTTVRIVVDGGELTDVLHLPRQAVFEKDDKAIVYVREGDEFVAKPVTIAGRTEGRVAVTGVPEGAVTALVDPTASTKKTAAKGSVLE